MGRRTHTSRLISIWELLTLVNANPFRAILLSPKLAMTTGSRIITIGLKSTNLIIEPTGQIDDANLLDQLAVNPHGNAIHRKIPDLR